MLGLPFSGDKMNQNCRPGFLFILVVFICSLAIGVFSQKKTGRLVLESKSVWNLTCDTQSAVCSHRRLSWSGRSLVLETHQQ